MILYTNKKKTEKEIRETTPFTIASNNIKYLAGSSNQVFEERNGRRYQKMERLPMLMELRIDIVKVAILPEAMGIFSSVPT